MKKQKGSVLVFALVILSFILLTSFSIASISLIERRSSDASVNSATAFQNSDKGMEEFLQQLYNDLDQTDTLVDLTDSLNDIYGVDIYECVAGNETNAVPITIGNNDTDFIISAFAETMAPSAQVQGGWNDVTPIVDCDTQLADVARFKVIGNHNNAVRAVFLKLRDSLTRGLIARWSFEDRAIMARVAPEAKDRVSYIAQDFSKKNHVLTLCKLRTESGKKSVEMKIIDENGEETKEVVEFDSCKATEDETSGMSPKRGYGDSDDDECEITGSWVKGIVEESLISGVQNAFGDNSNTEALKFNGSDYLVIDLDDNCGADEINCVDKTSDELMPTDGISISTWIKTTEDDGIIVSRWFNDDGYKLVVESGSVCMYVNNKKGCSSSSINISDDDWHNVVGSWREKDKNIYIFVDGKDVSEQPTKKQSTEIDNPDVPLSIGVMIDDTDNVVAGSFFTGIIDDVRMWDRALTCKEVFRICEDAEIGDSSVSPNPKVTCTKDSACI
jgi:hypothetical protein